MTKDLKKFPASRHPRSEEWKALLDHLLDNAEVCDVDTFTITFRLYVGEESSFFGLSKKKKYALYDVWIANKDTCYGNLHRVSTNDGFSWRTITDDKSPGYETIHRLYDLEQSMINKCYTIPTIKE